MSRLALAVLMGLVALASCQSVGGTRKTDAPAAARSPVITATLSGSPLPEFLFFTAPSAGEILDVEEYERLAPSFGWDASLPSICFSIAPYTLMEPGDFPTAEEWLARVSVTVDGRVIDTYHALLKTDKFGKYGRDPDSGRIAMRAPDGSPFRVCYAATLGGGQHTAMITVLKKSGGAVTYDWSFELME